MSRDNQKVFMDWLDTCPVVEFRDIVQVNEDYDAWIYTVDFGIPKEEELKPSITFIPDFEVKPKAKVYQFNKENEDDTSNI